MKGEQAMITATILKKVDTVNEANKRSASGLGKRKPTWSVFSKSRKNVIRRFYSSFAGKVAEKKGDGEMKSKWNVPETYRFMKKKLICKNESETPVFRYLEGEKMIRQRPEWAYTGDEVRKILDALDYEIINRIAASKYLTSLQIYEFMSLSNVSESRNRINKHLRKLMAYRVLQEYELTKAHAVRGLKVYCLDYFGNKIAYESGVPIHKGIKYMSDKKKQEYGIPFDTAEKCKRILMGNQILLNLLKSKVQLSQFSIMETRRILCDDSYDTGAIIRTVLSAKIDAENILLYEIVRDSETGMEDLIHKMNRYRKLISVPDYLISNSCNDAAIPQMVICGESFEHNLRIHNRLQSCGVFDGDVEVLFTEDLLNLGNAQHSIYAITERGMKEWYILPAEYEYNAWIA